MTAEEQVLADIAANRAELAVIKTKVEKALALIPAAGGIDAAGVANIRAALAGEATDEAALSAELPA